MIVQGEEVVMKWEIPMLKAGEITIGKPDLQITNPDKQTLRIIDASLKTLAPGDTSISQNIWSNVVYTAPTVKAKGSLVATNTFPQAGIWVISIGNYTNKFGFQEFISIKKTVVSVIKKTTEMIIAVDWKGV